MPSPDRMRAQSIGYLVRPWRPARGTVHSVYDTAVNLAVGETLYSVLPAGLPDGPTTVRVAEADFAPLIAVRRGDPVALRAATLRAGAIPIDLRTATLWEPNTSPTPAAPGLRQRVRQLADSARRRGGAGWIPDLVAAAVGASDPAAPVRALLGRGVGLTPAGDDALVGLLAAAWFLGARPVHRTLADAIQVQVQRTTDLSAAHLRLAGQGHFQQPVIDTASALLRGGEPIDDLRLLRVGATSGADCALGLAAAIDVLTSNMRRVAS